ncbi:MAG: hypothetical protein J1G07_04430 [Clostridiales bacterium]|nr:hypothetical protein [Clostridiales bacterium]
MDKFIITDKQKEQLKSLLTREEYERVIALEWEDFSVELSGCIDVRYIDDEPTKEAEAIENIYYEIYNQNL